MTALMPVPCINVNSMCSALSNLRLWFHSNSSQKSRC